jgi:Ca2+/Na+ antiporter
MTTVLLLLAGLAMLLVGGASLVRGASGIAEAHGISPLVVGLTVVAFGEPSAGVFLGAYLLYMYLRITG